MNQTTLSAKEQRKVFGVTGKPIQAERVFVKDMPFDHAGTETRSWLIITPDGRVIRTNSYNGALGRNFDPQGNGVSHPAPTDDKGLKRITKGYTEVTDESALPKFVELA